MSFVKLTQNRHPERSASQIYRVYTAPMARSRRTSAMHISPRLLGAFQPPKPPEPYGPPICFCCRLGSSFLYKEPLCPPPAKLPSPKSSCSGNRVPTTESGCPICPDFLRRFVALIHSMRLSLTKGAQAAPLQHSVAGNRGQASVACPGVPWVVSGITNLDATGTLGKRKLMQCWKKLIWTSLIRSRRCGCELINGVLTQPTKPGLPSSDLFLQLVKHAATGSAGLQCGPAVCAPARPWRGKRHW